MLKKNTILEILVHVVILFAYFWIASHGYLSFPFSKTPVSKTQYQAEAFLAGQIPLKIQPKPELLALDNPYDGRFNEHLRLHDASLFNGKYYLYFSPIVSLFITSPFKLLTAYYLPDEIICVVLCFIGYLFSFKTLQYLLQSKQIKLSGIYITGMQLCLGLAITQLYSLNRIRIYEVAIFSGYATLMLALYYYVRILIDSSTPKVHFFLSGLCLGFAVWARPSYFFTACILSAIFVIYHFYPSSKDNKWQKILLFFSPLLVTGIVIASYNYIRFGSITEFGLSYQLTVGFNYADGESLKDIFGIQNMFTNFVNYIYRDIQFVPYFPYAINCTQFYVPPPLANRYHVECQCGFLRIPIYTLFLFCIPLYKSYFQKYKKQTLLGALFLLCSSISFLTVSIAPMAAMRYMIDFLPLLTLSIFILLSLTISCSNDNTPKNFDILSIFFCFATFMSLAINFLLCFPGYQYAFIEANPHMYRTIEHLLTF